MKEITFFCSKDEEVYKPIINELISIKNKLRDENKMLEAKIEGMESVLKHIFDEREREQINVIIKKMAKE